MKLYSATTILFGLGHITLSTATRERIGQYVATGQQFLVLDPTVDQTIALYEDPDAAPVTLTRVHWFCPPDHAPDTNGDGEYDHIVSHALTYRPGQNVNALIDEGASVSGSWTPHGYVASWSTDGKTYDEVMVDYDDKTIITLSEVDENIASILGYEYSNAGGTGGVVLAGAGEWITDTSDPRLVAMAKDLGMDLTGDNCSKQYAQVWKDTNSKVKKDPVAIAGIVLCTIGIVTLIAAMFFFCCSVRSQKIITAPNKEGEPELQSAGASSVSWQQQPV